MRRRLAIFGGVLWALVAVGSLLSSPFSPWPALAWAGILVLIVIWILLEERPKSAARLRRLEAALQQNEAHEIRIQSQEMVEFEEAHDEGAAYAFQVGESIVFICGQDFYPTAKFPNTDFSMVEIHAANDVVVDSEIVTHGKKLKPLRTIATEIHIRLCMPEHLEVIPGRLDDLDSLLGLKQS
jgi:hypothetical protein